MRTEFRKGKMCYNRLVIRFYKSGVSGKKFSNPLALKNIIATDHFARHDQAIISLLLYEIF